LGSTGQSTSVLLTWSVSLGASSYQYCIDTTNDAACAPWQSVGQALSVSVNALNPGTPYYWHVRSLNEAGSMTYANGTPSAFWDFTTAAAAPGAFGKSTP